jgi:hypothetical protein
MARPVHIGPAIRQLRIYEVFDRNKVAFHARFRDHAMRIMTRHGFRILGTWKTSHEVRTEFAGTPLSAGEGEREHAAGTRARLEPQPPALAFGQPPADVQTEAGADHTDGARRAVERRE